MSSHSSAQPKSVDVVVIGGGAAGLMCAIEAGKRGRSVVVLEHNRVVGEKIRISGGGRCNFTNLHASPAQFVSENPRFCTSALARYTPAHFIRLVEKHRIPYHEKTLGQLFCDRSSSDIIDMLRKECLAARVDLALGVRVETVTKPQAFQIHTTTGVFHAESLVVATGGLSIPKLGASDLGHRLAAHFGLPVVGPTPGLVPLRWNEADAEHFRDLSGVSFPAEIRCGNVRFRESALFTHRGLSGPAVLQISSYWTPESSLHIDLCPDVDIQAWLLAEKSSGSRATVRNLLSQRLPRRLAHRWCEVYGMNDPVMAYRDKELRRLGASLRAWQVQPAGTEGYKKAEVTRGGVDTRALDSKTMEARAVSGLFFIGEAVDVTGWLGGYNFQWAWSSGWAAGQVA